MKRDVIRVFITNLIRAVVALYAVFLLPALIDVEQYAYIKLYQLYVSYIGFLHFGYCDGVYLKYGGKSLLDEKHIIDKDINAFKVFQVFISVITLAIGIVRHDLIVCAFGITIYPRNMRTIYEYSFQATGEFKKYSYIVNFYSIATIVFYSLLLFVVSAKDYQYFIIGFCLVDIITMVAGRIVFKEKFRLPTISDEIGLLRNNIKIGFFLMIGNFAHTLFMSIDKWFVKGFIGMTEFAYYSFAAQILMMITMFITPVSMTLYNYFSKKKSYEFENTIKSHLCSVIFGMLSFTFVAHSIILRFNQKYEPSIYVVSILFLSQIIAALNSSIFVNLFKTYKMQKRYFINLCVIIIVSVASNYLFYMIKQDMISFACATLFTMILLLFLNKRSFKHIHFSRRELLLFFSSVAIYIGLHMISIPEISVMIYIVCYIILLRLILPEEFHYWIRQASTVVSKIAIHKQN